MSDKLLAIVKGFLPLFSVLIAPLAKLLAKGAVKLVKLSDFSEDDEALKLFAEELLRELGVLKEDTE